MINTGWDDIAKSAKRSLDENAFDKFCAIALDKFLDQYRDGNKLALLEVVAFCGAAQIPIPEYFADEFSEAFDKVKQLEVESLDDAFGWTRPKR